MLAVEGMLEALSREGNTENYKNCNNDEDFGAVLEVCGNGIHMRKLMYSDGIERTFSFDD